MARQIRREKQAVQVRACHCRSCGYSPGGLVRCGERCPKCYGFQWETITTWAIGQETAGKNELTPR